MDYNQQLKEFTERLSDDQKKGFLSRWPTSSTEGVYAYVRSGRKYDKVIIRTTYTTGGSVRYFVDKSTGAIYGARSWYAPNLKWYFGKLETAHLWDWSDFHGRPINDKGVRVVGRYGPYERYMPV